MKVLIIEDNEELIGEVRARLEKVRTAVGISMDVARSKGSALPLLAAGTYDIVVCDRRIPTTDGALDAADEHGDAVFDAFRARLPGTPAVVLTAYASVSRAQALIREARRADVFGRGIEQPMSVLYTKDELPECLAYLEEVAQEISILEDIEIETHNFPAERPLRRTETRLIQTFARQYGSIVRVRPLGGGLSDALTCSVTVEDERGAIRIRTVAKLGRLEVIYKEERGYTDHIGSLNVGAFAPLLKRIDVGAGDVGGLFYSLADGYSTSLFELATRDPESATDVLRNIQNLLNPWTGAAKARTTITVGELRQYLVGDELVRNQCSLHLEGIDWEAFENRRVNVNLCPQHGDLHGHNVLVSEDLRPVLIDYGDVKMAPSALDAITLELSLLFHPKNVLGSEQWPNSEDAAHWSTAERFSEGSRLSSFILQCRRMAEEAGAGPRELCATAYAYALRQLKYADTDKDLARAIILSAMECFSS